MDRTLINDATVGRVASHAVGDASSWFGNASGWDFHEALQADFIEKMPRSFTADLSCPDSERRAGEEQPPLKAWQRLRIDHDADETPSSIDNWHSPMQQFMPPVRPRFLSLESINDDVNEFPSSPVVENWYTPKPSPVQQSMESCHLQRLGLASLEGSPSLQHARQRQLRRLGLNIEDPQHMAIETWHSPLQQTHMQARPFSVIEAWHGSPSRQHMQNRLPDGSSCAPIRIRLIDGAVGQKQELLNPLDIADHTPSKPSNMGQVSPLGRTRPAILANMHPEDFDEKLWWSDVTKDVPEIRQDMPNASYVSEIVKARIVDKPRHEKASQLEWFDQYQRMGRLSSQQSYIAVAIKMGGSYLVTLSEVVNHAAYESIFVGDFINDKLKFVFLPLNVGIPIPLKGPKAAETVGKYFGRKNVSFMRNCIEGVDHATIVLDLFSVLMVRMAFRNIGFTPGRIMDLYLLDYAGNMILTAVRLAITKECLKLLTAS